MWRLSRGRWETVQLPRDFPVSRAPRVPSSAHSVSLHCRYPLGRPGLVSVLATCAPQIPTPPASPAARRRHGRVWGWWGAGAEKGPPPPRPLLLAVINGTVGTRRVSLGSLSGRTGRGLPTPWPPLCPCGSHRGRAVGSSQRRSVAPAPSDGPRPHVPTPHAAWRRGPRCPAPRGELPGAPASFKHSPPALAESLRHPGLDSAPSPPAAPRELLPLRFPNA